MNKLKITAFLTMSVIVLGVISCAKKKDDNTGALLLLLALSNSTTTGSAASRQNATAVRNSVSGISGAVTSAAQSGGTGFNFKLKDTRSLLAMTQKQREMAIHNQVLPKLINTNITAEEGTISTSTTEHTYTFNGTLTQSASSGGGTLTLDKLKMKYQIKSTSSPLTIGFDSEILSGSVTCTNYRTTSSDYFDYPKYVTGVVTGKMTLTGKSNSLISNFATTASTA
ncbi:MAG: hypothetical protein K8R21_15990, partial [Leptospira sp.]|nr:hypothetical protein [Leptospira sp.]